MWETVAAEVAPTGGEVQHRRRQPDRIEIDGDAIARRRGASMAARRDAAHFAGDYFFSTMPVKELVRALDGRAAAERAARSATA